MVSLATGHNGPVHRLFVFCGTGTMALKFPRTLARAGLAAAIAAAATFGTAQAEDYGARVGEAIPHQLEVPDQTSQVQSFVTLKKNRGLIMLFSRSLAW
jgi:hypothetical protein